MDTPSPVHLDGAHIDHASPAGSPLQEPSLFAWSRQDLNLENVILFVATVLAVFLPVPPIGGTIAFGLAIWSASREHWTRALAALACTVYSVLPSMGVFVLVVSSGP